MTSLTRKALHDQPETAGTRTARRTVSAGLIIKLPPAISYVVAVGIAVAAVLLRLALDPVWGSKLPYITLFPAIMVSAWLGGLWPGIVTTAIAGTAAEYFWIEPAGSWAVAEKSELLGILVFGVVGFVISALNEARRRETDAVAESEERLRVTLSSIGNAVIATDGEGRVTQVNPIAEQLTGWTREEALGRPLKDIDADGSLTGPMLAAERGRQSTEGWLTAKGGRVSWVGITTTAIRDRNGQIRGFANVIHDLSERRLTEEIRRQSAQRFQALVEASAQVVWTTASDGEVVDDSPSWRAFTGQTFEQWRGSERRGAVHPDDRDRCTEVWKHALATKTPFETEHRLRRKDGEWRWMAARGLPLFNDDSTVREWIGMVTDVTERKHAEQERERLTAQLRTMNAELEERVRSRSGELTGALKEREALLQEVHHRVKNNLQVISSLINMQLRRLEDVASRDALEECRRRVQTIALIHETLYQSKDYSRVAFSQYVRSLASNVFQTIEVSASKMSLDLAIDNVALAVDKAIPCGLVLNELITNSLKHGFANGLPGTVRVEFSRLESGRLRLAVKDNGVGLPEGFDIATSESLGLQLVLTLSHQLDAELEVTGREGTSVQLTFAAEG